MTKTIMKRAIAAYAYPFIWRIGDDRCVSVLDVPEQLSHHVDMLLIDKYMRGTAIDICLTAEEIQRRYSDASEQERRDGIESGGGMHIDRYFVAVPASLKREIYAVAPQHHGIILVSPPYPSTGRSPGAWIDRHAVVFTHEAGNFSSLYAGAPRYEETQSR